MDCQTQSKEAKYERCQEYIASIEEFYKLKNYKTLVSSIMNKKQAVSLLSKSQGIAALFKQTFEAKDPNRKSLKEQAAIFAQRYTFQKLCEKYKKPRGNSDFFRRILRHKLKKEQVDCSETRRQLWLIAFGAKFYLTTKAYHGVYQRLWQYEPYPDTFDKVIGLDLRRTKFTVGQPEVMREKLKRVLVAFSRRNPYVGYCQGMNYIGAFLLQSGFSEQETFWLMIQLTETVIPMDYYTNMLGIAADQNIFTEMVKQRCPKVADKLQLLGLSMEVFTIQWLVCLFCNSLNRMLVPIVWDHVVVEGMKALLKTAIIIIECCQNEILQAKQFPEVIWVVERCCKHLPLSQSKFIQKYREIYVSGKGYKLAHDLYRQHIIKERLADKMRFSPVLRHHQICDLRWPICLWTVEKYMKNKEDPQVWVMRIDKPPNFINSYMDHYGENRRETRNQSKVESRLESKLMGQSVLGSFLMMAEPDGDLVMGRINHVCQSKQIPMSEDFQELIFQHDYPFKTDEVEDKEDNQTSQGRDPQSIILSVEDEQVSEVGSLFKATKPTSKQILQKSQSIRFYRNFYHNHREICQVIHENRL